jgi:hypothetical protein
MKAGVNRETAPYDATKLEARGMAMPSSGEHLPSGSPRLPETWAYLSNHAEFQLDNMELKLIAELAYRYWEDRGRPWGSSEEDGFEPSTNSKDCADMDSQPEPAIPFRGELRNGPRSSKDSAADNTRMQ